MADEFRNQNVIRVVKDGPGWIATIGPDPQRGLNGTGETPALALWSLMLMITAGHWIFDESWRPR